MSIYDICSIDFSEVINNDTTTYLSDVLTLNCSGMLTSTIIHYTLYIAKIGNLNFNIDDREVVKSHSLSLYMNRLLTLPMSGYFLSQL